MALFTTIPTNIMKPSIAVDVILLPVRNKPVTPPVIANGIENIMMNGYTKDSNCDAIII